MPSFRNRSYQKELLDRTDIPFNDIKRNMKELGFINKHLGGHDITLDGIVALIQTTNSLNKTFDIVEIGCGGGDNLHAIKNWAQHIQLPVSLTGIDINPECVVFAQQQQRNSEINFIYSDFKNVTFRSKPDIIFCSLFCHHFTDEELVYMLQWMKTNSSLGFFINDLHRHPIAFYSIKFLTSIFSRSYLVKNDAPISVLRGFTRKEWINLLDQAEITNYSCSWRWAFRWLITCPSHD